MLSSSSLSRGRSRLLAPTVVVAIVVGLGGCDLSQSGLAGSGGATASGGETGSGGDGAGGTGSGGSQGSGGQPASGGQIGSGGTGQGRSGGAGSGGAAATGGRVGTGGRATGGRDGTGGVTATCALPCSAARYCCGNACVNLQNDPFNCGGCGHGCDTTTSFCASGSCQPLPCGPAVSCLPTAICCGSTCCPAGDLCCESQGPVVTDFPVCHHPTAAQPTCPQGCAPLCVSDRNLKRDVAPIDPAAVLAKLHRLPIWTWRYTDEPPGVRHLGPMAQDFYASFGLGDSDRTYHSVDGHGVALAAIQALDRLVQAERERTAQLERENRALGKRLDDLEHATRIRQANCR
jgi:hypothetical protein